MGIPIDRWTRMSARRSPVRTVVAVAMAALGVFAIVNAFRAFGAIQQGGLMAGFGRDFGIAACVVGLVLVAAAIFLWRR
jgi:hypothetical protein